ncbi:MAG: hypothetical protein IV092_04010 [Burkholderiaceae bacterium]|nr:hypothetical protein [Burkholderiaceae bacterium]MBT9500383.1 hypothetical protein [Burkholderiaceae bacterium]
MAGPRSLFGRLLRYIRDGSNARDIVTPERERLRNRVAALRNDVNALPFTGLKGQLIGTLDELLRGETGLDGLPDIEARSSRLMSLIGSVDEVEQRLGQAQAMVPDHLALSQELLAAKNEVAEIGDDGLSAPLALKLATLEKGLGLAVAGPGLKNLEALPKLLGPAQALRVDIGKVLQPLREEKAKAKAYADALLLAQTAVAKLPAVVKDEAALIQKDFIDAAVKLHKEDKRDEATVLLGKVDGECAKAQLLAKTYTDALAAAKLALNTAKATMLAVDVKIAETQMIGAAEQQATAGKRQAALELLAQVKAHCDSVTGSTLLAQTLSDATDDFMALMGHAHAGAFPTEIAALRKRMDTARASLKAGTRGGARMDMVLLRADAKQQLAYANEHTGYALRLDVVKPKVEQVAKAAPVTSNTALTTELAKLKTMLDKAEKQAAKRFYDPALATLAALELECAAVTTLKQEHAAYALELARVEPLVSTVPDEPGTPSAAEAASLRERLKQAKALADPGRDFKGAAALLKRIGGDCDGCKALATKAEKDELARDTALTGLDGEPAAALAEVRKLLEALKVRDGHTGIAKQLADIEKLLVEAGTALSA